MGNTAVLTGSWRTSAARHPVRWFIALAYGLACATSRAGAWPGAGD
jgi:hypothetical protein